MSNNKTIWFDFENTPHVWVFKEFIPYFKSKGFDILITARDFSNTLGLCDYLKIPYQEITVKNNGKTKFSKFYAIILRSFKLRKFLKSNNIKPSIAISHGSRSQALTSFSLGIKQISLDDYEYSFSWFNRFVDYLLTPFPIHKEDWGRNKDKVINYPGLKEELYLFNKDNCKDLNFNLDNSRINLIFRPESTTAHYSSIESQDLQNLIIEKFREQKDKIFVILFPRDSKQRKDICERFKSNNINHYIPEKELKGPAIISECDLLVGGGGTMTREACVLGIPSYTFFKGRMGAVDKYLVDMKKLTILENKSDIEKIVFKKKESLNINVSNESYKFVVEFIEKSITR